MPRFTVETDHPGELQLPAPSPEPIRRIAGDPPQSDHARGAGKSGATGRLRVLIVDGDPDSRAVLEHSCRANDLQPLPAADTGAFALQLARMLSPDLVLVDADLPDMSGLELLDELKAQIDSLAGVVVTPRTDLAVRAYDAGAVDYVVKPFSNRRFEQAIARVRLWLSAVTVRERVCNGDRCQCANERRQIPNRTPSPVLIGERQHRLYVLDPARIEYVEAEGNYVIFHAAPHEYLSRDTLKRLQPILQACGFLRIENSLLLSVGAIDYAVPAERGRFVFTLRSGTTLRSSRTYRPGILKRLPLVRGSREVTSHDAEILLPCEQY